MMKGRICGLVMATAAVFGCDSVDYPADFKEVVLSGKPLSVEQRTVSNIYSSPQLTIMLEDEGGKKVFCTAYEREIYLDAKAKWMNDQVVEGATIVQSEIADNDNEPISLKGVYDGNKFIFTSVTANGYTVQATKLHNRNRSRFPNDFRFSGYMKSRAFR